MKKNRYPGVKPFEADERDRFFGRGRDIRDLYDLILLEKLVVVFGKSGYGKSSLLNAGILPRFEEETEENARFTPLLIRLGSYVEGKVLSPLDNFAQRLEERAPYTGGAGFLDLFSGEHKLWYEFKRRQVSGVHRFVLVFDQFEEFFSYPAEEQHRFKEQLAELLYQDTPQGVREQVLDMPRQQRLLLATPLDIKAVFVIREDRLSLLDSLHDQLPAIFHKRYELRALSREQAREAIVRPAGLPGLQFASPAFRYSPEALERILDELSRGQKEQQQKIEAFQLQVLCQYLESKVAERGREGATVQPADLPEAANIFEAYYNRQIGQLPEGRRLAARLIIEEGLILEEPATGEGRRLGVDGALLVQQFKDIGATPELLAALEDTFLLRREANALGGFNFEVSHDSLLPPILKAKAERKESEERLLREQEKEQIRKSRRRQRRVWGVIAVIGLMVISLFFLAWQQYQIAKQNKERSEQLIRNLKRKSRLARGLKGAANELLAMAGADSLPPVGELPRFYDNLHSAFLDTRNNKIYEAVELFGKVWMADNLDFPVDGESWYYNNDPQAGKRYGRLYTWEGALKACPPGWYLPTDEEWKNLIDSCGWYYDTEAPLRIPEEPEKAYQELIEGEISGFDAVLGGVRGTNGSFNDLGEVGSYWSASEYRKEQGEEEKQEKRAWAYVFNRRAESVTRTAKNALLGRSCRCVKRQ